MSMKNQQIISNKSAAQQTQQSATQAAPASLSHNNKQQYQQKQTHQQQQKCDQQKFAAQQAQQQAIKQGFCRQMKTTCNTNSTAAVTNRSQEQASTCGDVAADGGDGGPAAGYCPYYYHPYRHPHRHRHHHGGPHHGGPQTNDDQSNNAVKSGRRDPIDEFFADLGIPTTQTSNSDVTTKLPTAATPSTFKSSSVQSGGFTTAAATAGKRPRLNSTVSSSCNRFDRKASNAQPTGATSAASCCDQNSSVASIHDVDDYTDEEAPITQSLRRDTSSDSTTSMSNSVILQRRMAKATEHNNQAHGSQNKKKACYGCQISFWQFADRMHQICHNCVKIVEAVRAQALRHGGRVQIALIHNNNNDNLQQISSDFAVIQIHCSRGHSWTNDFKPRQGQRWCRECRRAEIAQHKAAIREQEEIERQRVAAQQAQMFQQAEQQFQVAAARRTEDDADVQFILRVVDAIIADVANNPTAVNNNNNNNVDLDAQDVQHQMVDVIMRIAGNQGRIDQVFHAIFDQIGERQQQQRVERRIKFMVHPDKNTHRRAKDAFQILSNSCWRRKKLVVELVEAELAFQQPYSIVHQVRAMVSLLCYYSVVVFAHVVYDAARIAGVYNHHVQQSQSYNPAQKINQCQSYCLRSGVSVRFMHHLGQEEKTRELMKFLK